MTELVVDHWWIAIGATVGTITIGIGLLALVAQSFENAHRRRTSRAGRPGRFAVGAVGPHRGVPGNITDYCGTITAWTCSSARRISRC